MLTTTDRNTFTVTTVSTALDTQSDMVYYTNCTFAGPQTCFNYNQTASCTSSCLDTALVCSDPYGPSCASIFSILTATTSVGSSLSLVYTQQAISYFCDTAQYGLEYSDYGVWPSVPTVFVYTTTTSTAPTFTPSIVPFSRTQASRPASQAQGLLAASTLPSSATKLPQDGPTRYMLAGVLALSLVVMFL